MKLTPARALLAVILVFLAVLGGQRLLSAGQDLSKYQRVSPDAQGTVRIPVGDLENLEVRFYRFLNRGSQEVFFFVGRDEHGTVQVGFDAGESHHHLRRGFSFQDGWVTDNRCDSTSRLSTVNAGGGGCKPTPLRHEMVGDELVLQERDVLVGWRYFR